ncbi:BppU family phage baseplate upper protein [uncultured Lactobacillus sp.]|uniref:BppU family phage baseplate upper protein n=1 Tax=uncultured Lactobacillus sp. TaxID=153152 RepID=UPI0025CF12F3|nr:BppU family phage baseplate upper protein [uncultured Lactobacillus sp.]
MDVFRLNLELDKTRPVINEPVTFRRKDGGLGSTQIIATITDHGQTVSDIKSAVFMCIKPDYKYVRENASVIGNIITYTLNNEVGTCPGIIKTAYFQINGVVSTQNFQINVEEAISPIF